MFIGLSQFGALALFAMFVSVAIGFLARNSLKGRVRYAAWAFVLFVLVSIAIGWLMYPFSH
ncbi:MAG TPA: hypothetical protein VMH00_03320 [Candidatus Limnocylindrales bacterium]|nr:hypothetical protein [Candidatus Limnocylindrales bacterium]